VSPLGESGQHDVIDQRWHLLPPSRLGERVELGLECLPTLALEYGAVGRRRGIEGKEPPGGDPGHLQLLFVAPAADDDLSGHRQRRTIPAATGHPLLNGRKAALGEVRRGVEGHHEHRVTYFTRQSEHLRTEPTQADGWRTVRVRPRVEERWHQGVRPELAAEVQRLLRLPRGEDGA
jgi:hypothetical protein